METTLETSMMLFYKYMFMSLVKPDIPIMQNSTGSIDNRKILLRCEEINAMAAIEKYAHTHIETSCTDTKRP